MGNNINKDFDNSIFNGWNKTSTGDASSDITGLYGFDETTGMLKLNNSATEINLRPDKPLEKGTGLFSGENFGSTMGTIGSIGSALASIYGIYEQKKFNNDMLDMEKKRVSRENTKVDKQQEEYDKVWQ